MKPYREDEPVINPAEKEETITPSWEKPKPRSRTQTFDAFPGVPMSELHNFIITDDALGHGGAKTKYRNNVEAIRTLQAVEADNRFATLEEQEMLGFPLATLPSTWLRSVKKS